MQKAKAFEAETAGVSDKTASATSSEFLYKIQEMFEKRVFLYLLKMFTDGQSPHMNVTEYGTVTIYGVDRNSFLVFSMRNCNPLSIVLLFVGLKKVPREKTFKHNGDFTNSDLKYIDKHCSLLLKLVDESMIKEDSERNRIKILYGGREFVKFSEFYSQLISSRAAMWTAIAGATSLLYTTSGIVQAYLESLFVKLLS